MLLGVPVFADESLPVFRSDGKTPCLIPVYRVPNSPSTITKIIGHPDAIKRFRELIAK